MAYGLVLTLDARLNEQVGNLWNVFERASIGKTPGQLSEPPHITLATSTDDSPDGLWRAAADVVVVNAELKLVPFGAFVGEKCVLYFNAVLSEDLRRVHREIHSTLMRDNVSTDPLYAPGNVLFHCTIATEIEPRRLPEATALLVDLCANSPGRAVAVDLWEFFPVRMLKRRELS